MKENGSHNGTAGTLEKLREQEREFRKNLILEAAEELFASEPFEKVSMRDIARKAGISTSSIYTYFPNQESLFIASALINSARLIDTIENHIQKRGAAALEDVIDTFLDFLINREAYFKMMTQFMINGDLHEDSTEKLNAAMRRLFTVTDSLFEAMEFKDNTRMMSHYFLSTLNGIVITFRKYPGRTENESAKKMKGLGKMLAGIIMDMKHAVRPTRN